MSFPSPGDLPDPGIELPSLKSPVLAGGSLPPMPPGKPQRSPKCVSTENLRTGTYLPTGSLWVELAQDLKLKTAWLEGGSYIL